MIAQCDTVIGHAASHLGERAWVRRLRHDEVFADRLLCDRYPAWSLRRWGHAGSIQELLQ